MMLLAAMGLVVAAACQPAVNETVHIQGSKGQLVGDIQIPEGRGKKPVTIIYHGLTGFRTEPHLMALNDSLLARGIATVRFDFNGHGESEGLFSEMTLFNELEDAKAIYNYVASLPWVDKKRISIAGHSQGGLETGLLAGDLGAEKIRSAVLLAPAACIHTMAESGNMFGIDIRNEASLPDSVELWGGKCVGKAYLQSALECDVFERTSHYTGPVLVVQALNDSPELMRDAARYPDYLPQAEFVELEGLTHCFPEDLGTPARIAAEFIAKHSL